MNLDELKIKDLKELINIFSPKQNQETNFLYKFIGEYCIIRSRNEGINAGFIKSISKNHAEVTDCRRIWYHKPKNKDLSWYEGVALTGLSSDSKISAPVHKIILEDFSLTICSKEAKESIINHETTKTNV